MTLTLINLLRLQPQCKQRHHLWPQSCAAPTVLSLLTWPSEGSFGSINQTCVTLLLTHREEASGLPVVCKAPSNLAVAGPCLTPSHSPFPSVHSTTLAVISSCLEQTALGTCGSFCQECSSLGPPRGPPLPVFRALLEKALPDIWWKTSPALHSFLILFSTFYH